MDDPMDREAFKDKVKKHMEARKETESTLSEVTAYDHTILRRFLLTPTEISKTEADQMSKTSSVLSFFYPDDTSRGIMFREKTPLLLYRITPTLSKGLFYSLALKSIEQGGQFQHDVSLIDLLLFLVDVEKSSQFSGKIVRITLDVFRIMLEGMKEEAERKKKTQALIAAPAASPMKSEEDVIRAFIRHTHSKDEKNISEFGKFAIKKLPGLPHWGLYREGHLFGVWSSNYSLDIDRNATPDLKAFVDKVLSGEKHGYAIFTPADRLFFLASGYHAGNNYGFFSGGSYSKGNYQYPKEPEGEKKKLDFDPVSDKTGIHWYETPEELLDLLAKNTPAGYHVARGAQHVYWIPDDWEGGIAICAHTDTVWHKKVEIAVRENGSAVSAVYGRGIGADDRAGILVSEEAAKRYPGKFVHMFFDGEEVGCTGSTGAPVGFPVDFFLSLDRRGNNQVALYGHDNPEVRKMLEDAGGTLIQGSNTDCAVLARRFGKCCANLSVGFHSEHQASESYEPAGVEYALSMLGKLEKRQFVDQIPEKHNTFRSYDKWTYYQYDGPTKQTSKQTKTQKNMTTKPIHKDQAFFNNRARLSDKAKNWHSFEDWDDVPIKTTPSVMRGTALSDNPWEEIEDDGSWEEIEDDGSSVDQEDGDRPDSHLDIKFHSTEEDD